MELLKEYLPGAATNNFANGGALYGLGFIHQGSLNQETIAYLL